MLSVSDPGLTNHGDKSLRKMRLILDELIGSNILVNVVDGISFESTFTTQSFLLPNSIFRPYFKWVVLDDRETVLKFSSPLFNSEHGGSKPDKHLSTWDEFP